MIALKAGQRMEGTRLVYIGEAGRDGMKRICRFICDCGNEIEKPLAWIRHNNTSSCGCLRREVTGAKNKTHGCAARRKQSGAYRSWQAMNQRAGVSKNHKHISVCDEWKWPHGFAAFLEHMGERPPGMTLDRTRNAEGYKPGNCRWATSSTQTRNTRLSVWIEHSGERIHQLDLMKKFGVSYQVVKQRMRRGMTRLAAITTPINKSKSHKRK